MNKYIDTLGISNKRKLRDAFGINNIREAYSIYGVRTANDAYEVMRQEYNRIIDMEREEAEAKKKAEKARIRAEKLAKRAEERRRAKEQAVREMAEQRKFNEARILDLQLNVDDNTNNIINTELMQICRQIMGKHITYITSRDGRIFYNSNVFIRHFNDPDSVFYEYLINGVQRYVNGEIDYLTIGTSDIPSPDNVRIVIFVTPEALPERLYQYYLDGKTHCVIQPLVQLYSRYLDNATSKEVIRKFKKVITQLNELEVQYSQGVPEERMHDIGRIVKRCIIIHDIIGNEVAKYNDKSSKYLRFTNTRKNHIEQNIIPIDNFEVVTDDEICEIARKLKHENVFYMTSENSSGVPNRILSTQGCFMTRNADYEVFSEFDKSINKSAYKLDAVAYPEINELVLEARIINACPTPLCDNPNELDGVNHIDLTKAYTQHHMCKHFSGFLGHITNWAKLGHVNNALEYMEKHIGVYQFKIIKNPSKLLLNLGLFEKYTYTLPSAEIIGFIKSHGMKIKLIAGAWGTSFDFEYTPEMLENRRYAIWAGKNGQQHDADKYTFSGDSEWARHLAYELGKGKVFHNDETNMITIKNPRKHIYTYHHILAFITAYTRLNILEILKDIPEENRVKVILDGIYYRGELDEITIPHKCNKEIKKHDYFRQYWYHPSSIDTCNFPEYDNRFTENAILSGAGGSGKTHAVFNCKSLIKPLYVVPTHILGKQLCEKYGCHYATINRLIGDGCDSYKVKYDEPHTILIDELTMIKKSDIEKALEMYPKSLILIAGDIDENQWYQCRNGDKGCFTELYRPSANEMRYVHFTNDYRSKDEQIKNFKLAIRDEMKRIFTLNIKDFDEDKFGGDIGSKMMNSWIKLNANKFGLSIISAKDAIKEFKSFDDVFIAGTHATNKMLLDNKCISGHINSKKEINYNGEGEKRGSFTIHSYQGLTISDKRVFIMLDTFEYAMLYTAISRCTNISQIVLVSP